MDATFSHKYRLNHKYDFQSALAKPKKMGYHHLLALYSPNQRSHARLGLIIRKQHAKRAVDRNLVRRMIRESFRERKEALKGLDIIVLLRSECIPLDKKSLRNEIYNLWQALAAKWASVKSSKPV
jgi:ribonuclease P protein component